MKRLILAALFVICGSLAHAGPLTESLRWGAVLGAASAADHLGSVYFSQRPELGCIEGNTMLRNPDGTQNGVKSFAIKAVYAAGAVGIVYVTKRLHWKPLEYVAKGLIVAQSSQSLYYSYKGFHGCH